MFWNPLRVLDVGRVTHCIGGVMWAALNSERAVLWVLGAQAITGRHLVVAVLLRVCARVFVFLQEAGIKLFFPCQLGGDTG